MMSLSRRWIFTAVVLLASALLLILTFRDAVNSAPRPMADSESGLSDLIQAKRNVNAQTADTDKNAKGTSGEGKPPEAERKGGKDGKGAPEGKPAGKPEGKGGKAGAGGWGGGGKRGGGRPPALVVTAAVKEGIANDRLRVLGNGTANASARVVPFSGGLLTSVSVRSGQQVAVGDVLAVLDSSEEQIARDRAARELADAERDSKRLEALFKSQTTTEVELNQARATLADATLALRDAALKLARRSITAPIAGSVGIVDVQKGNYITPQDVIATIDDRSSIVVEFRVPERMATSVMIGQAVTAQAIARKDLTLEGQISAVGSRIEADSLTLPVRARFENPADTLRPGMSFELQLQFEGQRYAAVDPLAVQWDSDGAYVWRVQEGKALRTAINIIQRNARTVLVASELKLGDEVVVEGVLSLRPGSAVRVAGKGRPSEGRSGGGQTAEGRNSEERSGEGRSGEAWPGTQGKESAAGNGGKRAKPNAADSNSGAGS